MIQYPKLPEPFPSAYEKFIFVSRYARWLEKEKRRESWAEAVQRLVDYCRTRVEIPEDVSIELYTAIHNLETMPSMRALMTAGPALEKNDICAYNCFTADEKFITDKGYKSFEETVGQKVNVLCADKKWRAATVLPFGKQLTQLVTFRPTKSRSSVRRIIKTTSNHRWITKERGVVCDLRVGDAVPSSSVSSSFNREAFVRGFGFGDGTLDNKGNAIIRLCGLKDLRWVNLFKEEGAHVSYYSYFNGDAMCRFKQEHHSNWKTLPYDKLDDPSYLSSWLQGYFEADGSWGNQPTLSSQNSEALDFVEHIAPLAGKIVTGRSIEKNSQTNYGTRKNLLEKIVLRDETWFYVTSIDELDEEEVYCVVEPETETFTLEAGIVTKNCAYLPVDSPRSFDEAMLILLNGTGAGFSVEKKYVDQLPRISEQFEHTDTTIRVHDSKEGWAKAYRELISLLIAGQIPAWDVTKVRAKGARLKTFGGRASGPEPLEDLFRFTITVFRNAAGRRLTSIECHDIMCKIADIVVVGGVRRSAMISLSDVTDERMRDAKTGEWWNSFGHRRLANNSAVYEHRKPDTALFMKEWKALYDSKAGERGFFSRYACQAIAARNGRRSADFDFGTNPCSEIILRPFQFCNLTEIVVRNTDTIESLKQKARIAAILGTIQSSFTNFRYLRKIWQDTCNEERLLGVSLTGICDNLELLEKPEVLEQLRQVVIDTNVEWANRLGISQSTATTCVKPSGTVSQLVNSASGLHTRYAPYYLRTVRSDNKDPLSQFLKDANVYWEPDAMAPDSTSVFYFPIKSPENSITRHDQGAIQALELWKHLQDHWCEHKPSATINVKEDEWMEVGAWVYKKFDKLSGVSFLPYDGGSYKQAPYQELTKEEFDAWVAKHPTPEINWDLLSLYELEDTTTSSQEFACVGTSCEIQ